MTDNELMQMALDALESATPKYTRERKNGMVMGGALDYWRLEQHIRMPTIEALRARLAQGEPEPVAWLYHYRGGTTISQKKLDHYFEIRDGEYAKGQPLYTAPPQRKWQGLTDEEIKATASLGIYEKPLVDFARAIEAKLKEKNA